MLVTACFQLIVVVFSGIVALLADTIHNFGDAATALPLWMAFVLARRKPTERFTYGLGRLEDLAGLLIVLIMALSALVGGYEAITRLVPPPSSPSSLLPPPPPPSLFLPPLSPLPPPPPSPSAPSAHLGMRYTLRASCCRLQPLGRLPRKRGRGREDSSDDGMERPV